MTTREIFPVVGTVYLVVSKRNLSCGACVDTHGTALWKLLSHTGVSSQSEVLLLSYRQEGEADKDYFCSRTYQLPFPRRDQVVSSFSSFQPKHHVKQKYFC